MSYIIYSPGSCGEFLQGYSHGHSFMVTCPINRYAIAALGDENNASSLMPKSKKAMAAVLQALHKKEGFVPLLLRSQIPVGKGMASSTADIAAVSQATALHFHRKLNSKEIAAIALHIEPSDATFFKGIVQFDYREGKVIQSLGSAPAMNILIYDTGGEINTIDFNSRPDLLLLQKKNESQIAEALSLFKEGMKEQSIEKIGKASTMSAFLNQEILYKKELSLFYKIGMESGGKGVICAHSGTILGLILSPSDDIRAIKQNLDQELKPEMKFLDSVQLTNDGMKIIKEGDQIV